MKEITLIALIVGVVIVALIILLLFARAWIKVARADEALVISGRSSKTGDGEEIPVTVIVNGKAVVNPISQRYEVISLRSRQVNMRAEAQSSDNVTLSVDAVALVKIGSARHHVRRAAERFASQDKAIENFTQDQLEGALRGVIAQQSVTELMRDRKKFSDDIANSVTPELEEQGLVLDSFQIRGITDEVGYIKSLGAPEIEAKRQAAEIAKTNAERAIAKERIANDEANLLEQTALSTNEARSDSEIGRARAHAEQAEALARAEAEQHVLRQRAENRQAELDAEVKRVADAEKYRRQQLAEAEAFEQTKKAEAEAAVAQQQATAVKLRAEASAEAIRLEGEARASAIKAEAEALKENQEALLAQRALEQLPELMQAFALGYSAIGSINVVSAGGPGGAGAVAGEQFAGESAVALSGVFQSIKASTGLDLAELIQGRAVGQATGQATGRAIGDALAAQLPDDDTYVTSTAVSEDDDVAVATAAAAAPVAGGSAGPSAGGAAAPAGGGAAGGAAGSLADTSKRVLQSEAVNSLVDDATSAAAEKISEAIRKRTRGQ